jgi:hypothetical protein
MTTKAGVGTSHHHSPSIAGHEAAEQALEKAGIAKPDFVFMFASVGYDQRALLRAVREATGGAPLCGCSGEGTINGEDADESDFSVVVMGVSSDEWRWRNGLATGLSTDSHATGQRVTQSLSPQLGPDAVGLFVFPDGIMVNFAAFLAGLQAHLPADLSPALGRGCR